MHPEANSAPISYEQIFRFLGQPIIFSFPVYIRPGSIFPPYECHTSRPSFFRISQSSTQNVVSTRIILIPNFEAEKHTYVHSGRFDPKIEDRLSRKCSCNTQKGLTTTLLCFKSSQFLLKLAHANTQDGIIDLSKLRDAGSSLYHSSDVESPF